MSDNHKKVFVGMSGGVDSSVSALLLKEQGYDVTGVFIKVWQPDFIECTWKQDRLDAMRVASELDIPFMTLDLEKEYKEHVIDYMMSEYKAGRTPNPDVMCNRFVKFGGFWKWAKEQGADYIATGHYVMTDGKELLASKDTNKDQTYFLWTLTHQDLQHVLFPIGHLTKPEVRQIAEAKHLPVASKKDSQGLCFVGTIDVKDFLKTEIVTKQGDVVDEKGQVIGSHEGAEFFTLGERHGFTIFTSTVESLPYYVVGKNMQNNTLVVAHQKPEFALGDTFSIGAVSWTNEEPKEGTIYEARARYRAPLAKIKITKGENTSGDAWIVQIVEGELTPIAGQSLVLYQEEKCIGGGVIV